MFVYGVLFQLVLMAVCVRQLVVAAPTLRAGASAAAVPGQRLTAGGILARVNPARRRNVVWIVVAGGVLLLAGGVVAGVIGMAGVREGYGP